jgi:hypothetical protein
LTASSLFPGRDAISLIRPDTPRMQKLRQLSFDHRASSVLRAWAKPKQDETEEEKKKLKDPLDVELATFQRAVTLSQWLEVKKYLASLPEDEGKAGYKQLLQSLQGSPGGAVPMVLGPNGPMPAQQIEQNTFTIEDVVGLASAAPHGLDKDLVKSLAAVLQRAISSAAVVEGAVARFGSEIAGPTRPPFTKRQAAQLLIGAGEPAAAGTFLPTLEQAIKDKDHEGLNLLARHFLGLHDREKKVLFLERAWAATQGALALTGGKPEDKEEAVRRALELAPRLKEELGQKWLDDSFTTEPKRGMEVLATIGSQVAIGLQTQPMNSDERLKALKLQKTAVEALLKAAPQRATEWHDTLTLLAGAWLREAEYTQARDISTTLGARMRRDIWGNLYFMNDDDPMQRMMMMQQNQPLPIRTGDVLDTAPEEGWAARAEPGLQAKLTIALAHLYLKVGEMEKAYPYVLVVAKTHPNKARDLVRDLIQAWTRTHDPNSGRMFHGPYFFYGFESRAESIPLTRSKQERNLVDLANWVKRLRALPVGELDEELLAKAFTSCHSSAEVYRLEAIETVFGPLKGIKPRTLAALAQQMRENLAGVWRDPANQEDKKTKRKPKDIQAEVLRGYALAGKVIADALVQFPDDWALTLARAALLHDETNYRHEVAKNSEYSKKRDESMAGFARAAQLYAAAIKDLRQDEESIKVYEQWFYASLGACDLQHINEEKLPDLKQPPLIHKAIESLPADTATRHMDKLANTLFIRMSSVKPAAKYRYLRSGFDIVGDHKLAREAHQVYDYYKDLVSEIKLEALVDGSNTVGHGRPFGVYINLRHTREIERESGGFGKYLQNQNNLLFSWNYGRPPTDYREKFQTAATEALKEQFEVLSVTFQTDKVNSRATREYGWRYTPYAYLLLKPRGPQVDKMPPIRMDLDFLDTSGYVVLPIESPAVPIDAKPKRGDTRPVHKLKVTQILDERQANQGKLSVEVKASGLGLVGDLDEVLRLAPEGFDIAKVEDQGLSVARFDPDSDENAIQSERTWLVRLETRQGQGPAPRTFQFGTALVDGTEMTYQRYQDADLANAEAVTSLEHEYSGPARVWLWVLGSSVVGAMAVMAIVLALVVRRRPRAAAGLPLPATLTPFTLLVFLRRVRQGGKVPVSERDELDHIIADLERRYFADEAGASGAPNLREMAERWARAGALRTHPGIA